MLSYSVQAMTEYHGQQKLPSYSSGDGKSKIKSPAADPPGSQIAVFSLCPLMVEGTKRSSLGSLL